MKRSWKELLIRVLILLTGLSIAHLGVTLFLLADLGADPFNVMVQGIYRTLSAFVEWKWLTHGNTHIVICLVIIMVLLAADRTYIKIGTILCMICGGPIIDFFTAMLRPLFTQKHTLAANIVVLTLGCVILAYGMTVVIQSDAGTGPNDLVAVVLSDKLHRKFGFVRIAVDVGFVALGYVLGGSVGIGTVICACLVGPVAGLFLPFNGKIIRWILDRTVGS